MTTTTEALLAIGIPAFILTRWMTGHTPLRWLALLLVCLEAGFQQGFKSLWLVAEDYRAGYLGTLHEIRRGFGGAELRVIGKDKRA